MGQRGFRESSTKRDEDGQGPEVPSVEAAVKLTSVFLMKVVTFSKRDNKCLFLASRAA